METRKPITRRSFGKLALASGAAYAAGPALNVLGANEKILMGTVGCSGRGFEDMRNFMRNGAQFIAVCDVDQERLARGQELAGGEHVATYKDFRNLIERNDIDAVLVATPDHWHALPFITACQAGKDVYVEKPLSVTIYEGQKMIEAARKYKRVSQCGTQQHSGPHYREAVQLLHEGHIGRITKVMCWNWGNGGGMGKAAYQDPPKQLDWDFWLGPTPEGPYFPQRCHGGFRFFWNTSGGTLTDWGTHHFDIIQWALQENWPQSISAEGGKLALDDCRESPDTMDVIYRYKNSVVQFSLRSGSAHDPGHPYKVPGTWRGYGIEFYGSKGTLFIDRNRYEIWPEEGDFGKGVAQVEKMNSNREVDMDDNHVNDFMKNIKTRGRCVCDVEVCHRATGACHLGNIAYRSGERIVWDGEKERIDNHKNLNSWLKRKYRKPWKLVV